MVITDITPQKKNKQVYSVYVDGQFSFSLGDLELSASGLRIGGELDKEELTNYIHQSQASKAYGFALRYLAIRQHSAWELKQYLQRKEFHTDIIDETVAKLERLGYVNDVEFGRMWVQNRIALKPRPKRILERELHEKHLDKETMQLVLSEVSENMDDEILIGIIQKKQKIPRYRDEQKLTDYLIRKGFSFSQIKNALRLSAYEYESQSNSHQH